MQMQLCKHSDVEGVVLSDGLFPDKTDRCVVFSIPLNHEPDNYTQPSVTTLRNFPLHGHWQLDASPYGYKSGTNLAGWPEPAHAGQYISIAMELVAVTENDERIPCLTVLDEMRLQFPPKAARQSPLVLGFMLDRESAAMQACSTPYFDPLTQRRFAVVVKLTLPADSDLWRL
ncbi:hypothetical protein JCM8097_002669 [Rhodosporidiobolus ruineniae]